MCDDKNILAVDQETFSDCKNVYVDSEGLLRSRPSLKIKTVTYSNAGNEYTLSDILDVWTFNDVTVYLSTSDKKYYLTFVNKNVANHIQRELKYTDSDGESHSYSKVMPILADNKIFIFRNTTSIITTLKKYLCKCNRLYLYSYYVASARQ